MTLPPQQPSVSPVAQSASQPPAPQIVSTAAAQASVPANGAAAMASSYGGAQEDRFAAGARMGMPSQEPAATSPFEEGVVADPSRVFFGPGYNFPPAPVNRPAQFALWVSIVAILFFFPLVASIGGAIWGLVYAHTNHGVGRRQAVAALVISVLAALWWLFVWAAFMGLLPASL